MNYFNELIKEQKHGNPIGIFSACSSNELVIEAALRFGKKKGCHILIESTSNQVHQYGGYTGMKPLDFYEYVTRIANSINFDTSKLILGGDHLGPNPFQEMNENEAMIEAEKMIREYVRAGFTKIHVDCSMRLGDDSHMEKLSDETIAKRTARLIKIAEQSYKELLFSNPNAKHPVYIVGSEVPIPGGALEQEQIQVTSPSDFKATINHLKQELDINGLSDVFKYVIAVVVQPGVEFGSSHIDEYDREKARALTESLKQYDSIIFEGHSTDYQTEEKLTQMVEDGVAILKVGPQLTFALREALFALSRIEDETSSISDKSGFVSSLINTMKQNPKNYAKHYHGDIDHLCKYSLLDRSRYYLGTPEVVSAQEKLLANLDQTDIELTLLSQYLPNQYTKVRNNEIENMSKDLVFDKIEEVLETYYNATKQK